MKTDRLFIRISSQLKEQVKALADKQDKSVSEFIIDLIKLEIARQSK